MSVTDTFMQRSTAAGPTHVDPGLVALPDSRSRGLLPVLRIILDAVAIGGAVALAFPLRFRWKLLEATPAPLDLSAHLAAASLWVVALVVAMATSRLYDEDALAPGSGEMARIVRSVLQAVAVVSGAVFLLRLLSVSRGWLVLVVVLSVASLAAERRAVRALIGVLWARGHLRRPAILVSTEGSASPPDVSLEELDIVATVRPHELAAALPVSPGGRRGSPVVIVDGDLPQDELWRMVMDAGDAGAPVFLRSPFRPLPADRLATRALGERTIVKVSPPALTGLKALQKRVIDLAASATMLVALAPVMAAIALGVVATSGRPVLYRQQRVGRNGLLFGMWKFRTMAVDAEARTGPVWATADDPRRTAIGRFLRRISLDELPQLWNVLLGQMSIVGPRPERPLFVARFEGDNPWYRFRHRIRPGMTGLAQVRGLRGNTLVEPRVESDNWYIEHWSLWLDLRIAAGTVRAMVSGTNGH